MAAKKNPDPSKDAGLKKEVHAAVTEAEHEAKTGNVETVPESQGGPTADLPTGTRRSHPPA